jgi:sugar (pentulose or hexulose) kinase
MNFLGIDIGTSGCKAVGFDSTGMDHHCVMGRGHFAEDLVEFNHWLGVKNVSVSHPGSLHGLKFNR